MLYGIIGTGGEARCFDIPIRGMKAKVKYN
jgi:hypothetical protein